MQKSKHMGSSCIQHKPTCQQRKSVMAPIDSGPIGNTPVDTSELGTQTEAEKHLKDMLNKQLETKLTMKQHFEMHRHFAKSSTYTPLSELLSGSHSLEEFIETEKSEETFKELQSSGLSNEEITLYLLHINKSDSKKQIFPIEPSIWKQKIELIEEKLNQRHEAFVKPQTFKGAKILNRHEMDIEKSLYAGCSSKNQLASLVTYNDKPLELQDHIFKHINDMSKRLMKGSKRPTKKKKYGCDATPVNISEKDNEFLTTNTVKTTEECQLQFDPNIHHAIIPLESMEVNEQKLSLDVIKEREKFKNYNPGNPSKVLYLKNLHSKTTIEELRALFGSFENENGEPLSYRLFTTGRMKGQAFVDFKDVKIAEKALHFANGYCLRQRPIVIEYGRNPKHK